MPFPYSDAGFYDYLSQSLLIGTNYLGGIPPRPLYVTFLAILHFFFGQNYPAIIAAQTLVLAFFPVTLYFLAKKLHTPAAGVTVALFAIFRELVGLVDFVQYTCGKLQNTHHRFSHRNGAGCPMPCLDLVARAA